MIVDCGSWEDFESRLKGYFHVSSISRKSFVFRGLGNSDWGLETTLDRCLRDIDPESRLVRYQLMLQDFGHECLGIAGSKLSDPGPESVEVELLARHHGLPSPILDWTRSPFVAAFFAYSDSIHTSGEGPDSIAIYMMDRRLAFSEEHSNSKAISEIIIDYNDYYLLGNNIRAIEQKSAFYKIIPSKRGVESLLDNSVVKFVVPSRDCEYVMVKLDEMGINHRSLFRDLDSVAKTVVLRYAREWGVINV